MLYLHLVITYHNEGTICERKPLCSADSPLNNFDKKFLKYFLERCKNCIKLWINTGKKTTKMPIDFFRFMINSEIIIYKKNNSEILSLKLLCNFFIYYFLAQDEILFNFRHNLWFFRLFEK